MPEIDPIALLRPRRKIEGASAILLPFDPGGEVDWPAFAGHLTRTADAGLAPAVNMDTGYANLIGEALRVEVLRRTASAAGHSWQVRSSAIVREAHSIARLILRRSNRSRPTAGRR